MPDPDSDLMTYRKNDRAVMIFAAILVGLLFAAIWRVEAGLFAALIVGLVWSLLQQRRRLDALEEEVRRLAAALSAMRGRGMATTLAEVSPASGSETAQAPARPRTGARVASTGAEAPLDLDVDFAQFDEPVAPPARPAQGPAPSGAGGLEIRLLNRIKGYFSDGNLMVRVGVIVLFFGVAFLLKYAAEHSLLPIELRLAGTALGGLVILVIGWRLRQKREAYALTLQGGAVGVLYLTVFAGLRLYGVIPPGLAFGLLLIFVVLSAALALLQNSLALIVLASAGGFLAPVLTSTGEGSHLALFSYYLLLNAGILTVAWFKAWRVLNLLGFGFTFVIGSLWGAHYYQPAYFATTEPFLIAFFLLYVGIAVLFALRQPPNLTGLVDGSLVFGVPLVAAGLQAALVKDFAYGLAFSALGLGGFYILLAALLFRRGGRDLRMLSESFLATGVVFTTLAVPFAFEGHITSAFWALEGAALVWVGLRQSRRLPRLSGAALQLLAGLFYLLDAYRVGEALPVFNALFLGTLLIALGGWFSSYFLERFRERTSGYEQGLAGLFFVWGFVWWLGGCVREIEDFSVSPTHWAWLLGVLAFTAVASELLRLRLDWPRLRYAALGLLPLLILVAWGMQQAVGHPFVAWAVLAWPLALVSHYWLLRHYDDWRRDLLRFWHAGAFWLMLFLLAAEAAWQVDRLLGGAPIWRLIPWALVPMLMLLALLRFGARLSWPVGRFAAEYTGFTPAPVILYLLAWGMLVNLSNSGDARPLAYLPVINPLDLLILFTLLVTLHWWRHARDWLRERGIGLPQILALLGALLFLWLNGMVTRTVHHWAGVPLQTRAMLDSQVFQASISVLWATLGLSGMLLGNWFKTRLVWQLAAGLMGLVVLKLFLVDLSNTGTVARIVSFIGVGLLLLVVGYFSPAPPRERHQESPD